MWRRQWTFVFLLLTSTAVFGEIGLTCGPNCLPRAPNPTLSDDLDLLFETDPVTAIEETTGVVAGDVTDAKPRPDGGAIVDAATSLTTPHGHLVEDIVDAEIDGEGTIVSAEQLEFKGTKLRGAANFKPYSTGFWVEAAAEVVHQDNLLVNGEKVRVFSDGTLTAGSADSLVKGTTITTEVAGLNAKPAQFSILSAAELWSRCIRIPNLGAATVRMYSDGVEITPQTNTELTVNDCSAATAVFEPQQGGRLFVDNEDPAHYQVKLGALRIESDEATETINTATSAQVEVSRHFGVECVSLSSGDTYWIDANELRHDLGLHIPIHAPAFKLCIRKHLSQVERIADGSYNLVFGQLLLRKQSSLLRYPVSNGQPASLVMNKMLSLADGFEALLFLGNDTITQRLRITGERAPISATITTPNNYITVAEKPVQGVIRRLLAIDLKRTAFDTTDLRVSSYESSYFEPRLRMKDGETLQVANTRITVLAPGDERIAEIVG